MDVHFFSISDHGSHATEHTVQHSSQSVVIVADIEEVFSNDDCGDLGGHCSHISSHLSGIVSSISFPSLENQPVFSSSVKTVSFIYTQAPPRRPPKA